MLNELYLNPSLQAEMREAFVREGHLRLDHFLELPTLAPLTRRLWHLRGKHVFQAHLHSFLQLPSDPFLRTTFAGPLMKRFIGSIVGKSVKRIELTARSFSSTDFTLLHDSRRERGIHFYYVLSETWNPAWGGSLTFVLPRAPSLLFTPQHNALFLIAFTSDMRSFIQYITNLANRRSFIVVEGRVL